jgi:hypothetical protein
MKEIRAFLQPGTDDDQTAGLIAKNQVVAELTQSAHGATGRLAMPESPTGDWQTHSQAD